MPTSQIGRSRFSWWRGMGRVVGAGMVFWGAAGSGVAGAAPRLLPLSGSGSSFAAAPSAAAAAPSATTTITPTLSFPYGVTVDVAGRIYVANTGNNTVTVYSPTRALEGTISAGLSGPAAVGVSSHGFIYVANNSTNNVTIYNSALAQTGSLTSSTFNFPFGLLVDAADDVWVLDANSLHVFLDTGTEASSVGASGASALGIWYGLVGVFGSTGTPYGKFVDLFQNFGEALHNGLGFNLGGQDSFQPGGIAVDPLNEIYKTDPANNTVLIYGSDGVTVLATISTASPPYGIAVDPFHKRFYVAEPAVNKVAVYSTVAPYKLLAYIH